MSLTVPAGWLVAGGFRPGGRVLAGAGPPSIQLRALVENDRLVRARRLRMLLSWGRDTTSAANIGIANALARTSPNNFTHRARMSVRCRDADVTVQLVGSVTTTLTLSNTLVATVQELTGTLAVPGADEWVRVIVTVVKQAGPATFQLLGCLVQEEDLSTAEL